MYKRKELNASYSIDQKSLCYSYPAHLAHYSATTFNVLVYSTISVILNIDYRFLMLTHTARKFVVFYDLLLATNLPFLPFQQLLLLSSRPDRYNIYIPTIIVSS